uniref:RNA-dependent RNA polymerase n=1 Tax=Macrostomum lignano TaxID=282301 RepID=A0A1I8JQ30_9PLAT
TSVCERIMQQLSGPVALTPKKLPNGRPDAFDFDLMVSTLQDARMGKPVRVARASPHGPGQRGRSLVSTLNYHTTEFVKPAFEGFCLPTKKYADLVLPRRPAENLVAR